MVTTLNLQSSTVKGYAHRADIGRLYVFSANGLDVYRTIDMQRVAWATLANVTCGAINDNGIYIGTSDAGVYRLPYSVADCANGDLTQVFGATADVVLSSYNILSIAGHGSALAIVTETEFFYIPDRLTAYAYTTADATDVAMNGAYLAWATATSVFIRNSHPVFDWDSVDADIAISDRANRLAFEDGTDNLLICHAGGLRVVDCTDPGGCGVSATEEGLVGHWTMDNLSGATLYDEQGTQNGTISGATQVIGKIGKSLSFDGINDFVDIPHNASLKPTAALTYSAWAYLEDWSAAGNTRLISCTQVGGWNFEFDQSGEGLLSATVRIGSTYYHGLFDYTTLAAGWHLFTATCDGRYVKLFVDGILVSTDDSGSAGSILYSADNSLIIGGEAGSGTGCAGNYWQGRIDDVRIYNRVLSVAEVLTIFAEAAGAYGISYDSDLGTVTNCQAGWKAGDYIAYGTSDGAAGGRFGVLDISDTPTDKTTVSGDCHAVWIDAALTTAIHDDQLERYRLVAQISPAVNASAVRRDWSLYAEIIDALGGIQSGTVELTINGQTVSPTISAITDGYAVAYTHGSNSGYAQRTNVTLSGTDSDGNTVSKTWSFVTASAPAATVTDTTPPNVVCTRDIGLDESEADETIGSIPVIWLDDITGPLIVTDAQAVAVGTVAIDGVTYHRHRRSVRVDPTDAGGLRTRDLRQGQVITVTCPAIGMIAQKCEVLAAQRNLDDTDEISFDLQIAYYEAVS